MADLFLQAVMSSAAREVARQRHLDFNCAKCSDKDTECAWSTRRISQKKR